MSARGLGHDMNVLLSIEQMEETANLPVGAGRVLCDSAAGRYRSGWVPCEEVRGQLLTSVALLAPMNRARGAHAGQSQSESTEQLP